MLVAVLFAAYVSGQESSTPVPILRQINRVNDDGSYTFGFEAADGTFKIETRDEKGNVKGKYGYLDETGELKVVEYSAGKDAGFNAHGHHIPVPAVPVTSSRGNLINDQRSPAWRFFRYRLSKEPPLAPRISDR